MEVTRQNFESVFLTLSDVFNRATFLSFDTEFTGFRVEGAPSFNYYYTLDDLYTIDRLQAETFLAVQVGIVAFFYNEKSKRYSHQAYNFYVYPSTYSNVSFTCQSKNIECLVNNGFDFNKVFACGIPYIKDSELDKLVEKLEAKFEKMQGFDSFFSSDTQSDPAVRTVISNIQSVVEKKEKSTLKTERYNSFVRKQIYSEVKKKYGNKIFMKTNNDETMSIYVGFTEDQIKEIKNESYNEEKNKILKESGFCKVIKLIMDSGKVLVGHNLLMDLMFAIQQFLTPLPETYAEFKELTHFLFPKLLDTKFMARSSEFRNLKDTSLLSVIDYFTDQNHLPVVEVAENGHGYDLSDKKHHEAAYDAYMTGLAFLAMCKVLGVPNEKLPESTLLKSKLNKLSVPRMQDITHMNVGGPDVEPDRKGVYYLTFPRDWKREDIVKLFQNYGFVNMSWIDSTSAFIQVKHEFVADVEKNMINSRIDSNYELCSYKDYYTKYNRKNDNFVDSKTTIKEMENWENNLKSVTAIRESPVTARKRQIEDVGEIIERPSKKYSA